MCPSKGVERCVLIYPQQAASKSDMISSVAVKAGAAIQSSVARLTIHHDLL